MPDNHDKSLVIVGAGPTGLTAAVELARRGIIARVVDQKQSASPLSRAVGINARTLTLLKDSGVSDQLINTGIKVRRAIFHANESPVFSIDLSLAPKPFDFLLALPQDVTETILIKKFESLGGKVEYGIRLEHLEISEPGGVSVVLENSVTGEIENAGADFLVGADGIHSKVRECAGIKFEGFEVTDDWSIVDFDSASWPHKNELCFFFAEHGKVCVVVPIGENRYRGVTDRPNAKENMPLFLKMDRIRREGNFVIWVKQAPVYQAGNVFIAGDAAHSHSPVGGRGMNLGIADAVSFAKRFTEGSLAGYSAERHPIGAATIKTTETGRRFATSVFPGKLFVLNNIFPILARSEYVQRRIVKIALDYPGRAGEY